MIYRSSQIKTAKQCIAKAYYKYHLGLAKPANGKPNPDLFFGSAVHKAVEILLTEDYDSALQYIESLHWASGPKTKNIAKILVNLFRLNFKDKFITSEKEFEIEISQDITLKGRYDFIGEDFAGMFVGELKTTSPFYLMFKPNDQFISYYIAGKREFSVDKVIVYNLDPALVDYNKIPISYSKREESQWLGEMVQFLHYYQDCITSGNIVKTEGACLDFGRKCSYLDLCTSSPEVQKMLIESSFVVDESYRDLAW